MPTENQSDWYVVTGHDRASGRTLKMRVRAINQTDALSHAARAGLDDPEALPERQWQGAQDPSAAASLLLSHPILCIAAGTFLGAIVPVIVLAIVLARITAGG
jgi:hypothetical protein